jgi:Flp pilus assembly protein TadG
MRTRRLGGEAGAVVTETVIVVPVLLLLITLVFQFALWYHAEHVVQAAAEEGVRAARLQGGTAADGQTRAEDFLSRAGPTIVHNPTVTATRDPDTATVAITGTAVEVIPGLRLPLHSRATAVVERFRPPPPIP